MSSHCPQKLKLCIPLNAPWKDISKNAVGEIDKIHLVIYTQIGADSAFDYSIFISVIYNN